MNNKNSLLIKCFVILSLSFSFSSSYANDDLRDVQAAQAKFYIALNTMFKGDIKPMQEIWSHAADVVFMGPSGTMQVGWQAVLTNWQQEADLKLGGEVKPEDIHIQLSGKQAVSFNYEEGKNYDNLGKPFAVKIRTTNVFRKENGAWKMVGHHTDRMSYLKDK